MNWLFYLSVWWLGYMVCVALMNKIGFKFDSNLENVAIINVLLPWTMLWVWICWKFIK